MIVVLSGMIARLCFFGGGTAESVTIMRGAFSLSLSGVLFVPFRYSFIYTYITPLLRHVDLTDNRELTFADTILSSHKTETKKTSPRGWTWTGLG